MQGATQCFYSPSRAASHECAHCGVLMSEPWAARWGDKTVCLKCLEHLRVEAKESQFRHKIVLWDSIALQLALMPFTIILWWAVFFSAPAALCIAVGRWNAPRSMTSSGRKKMILAATLALLQIAGVIAVIVASSTGKFKK